MVFGSGNKFRIKRSQSKASYLSAYKREPREREKGLPNFEGSYKRTASPNNNGGRGDVASAITEPQDVENVAPDGNDCCSNILDLNGGGRLQSLQQQDNNNTSQQQQLSSTKPQQAMDVVTIGPTVLSEQQQQPQSQLSKTLPRANNSTGQDFKRSSRTPRTQSDPSNMPNKADAAIATLQQMMMIPPAPRHSESASSLQKRSQSDLSQVGSTESGYSSLSLNVPSPSHSPTRLSSGDFGGTTTHVRQTTVTVTSTATTTSSIATTNSDDLDECTSPSWQSESAHRYHQRSVSRSCSTVSSDTTKSTGRRVKSPEEIECEELSRDLISHLAPSDKLHNILAPGPEVKRSTDYVSLLFRMDLPRSRTSVAEKLVDDVSGININDTDNNDAVYDLTNNGLTSNASYCATSESKKKLPNHYSRQKQPAPPPPEFNGIGNLQKKKADLVSRLDRKLKVLRDEQIALIDETAVNEALGETVANRVKAVAKVQEANKFKTHVQEVGHITSLLLSLSGRLAKAENALLDLNAEHPEKKSLEEKKSKLTCQLEEAKDLKENIDRRGEFVSSILRRYLTLDEYSDYDHFIAMKAKLLIDAREITDKIQLGEEQLYALKETLED